MITSNLLHACLDLLPWTRHAQVYGTSKTDKDLTFSAAALELLEQHLSPNEQQLYPLVMRPGMRLPSVAASSPSGAAAHAAADGAVDTADSPAVGLLGQQHPEGPQTACGSQAQHQQQQQVLTWRRYFATQLAAVYSSLFRQKAPRMAAGCGNAAPVEHDFVYVR